MAIRTIRRQQRVAFEGSALALRSLVYRVLLLSLASTATHAQGQVENVLEPRGPEAQYLELVDLVEDPPKQLELLDAFVIQFPRYAGMGAIHAQIQELCVQLRFWDRALAAGDKLLASDPSDTNAIRLNIQAAEGKKDAALAAQWRERLYQVGATTSSVTATSTIRLPWVDDEPAGDETAPLDLGSLPKQQRLRVEAALFNRALAEKDAKSKLKLLSLFARDFPSSVHTTEVQYLFFVTYRDTDQHPKALAAAEAVLERDKTREDVLFYVAQKYFLARRETAKTLAYMAEVQRLVAVKPKPEHVSDEQWERQKKLLTLHAHWIPAAIRSAQEQWPEADRLLRAALPLSEPGGEMRALILTSLGWANYKLRRIPEALAFYKECAAINSPLRQSAEQSITSIKSEYSLQ